MQVLRKLTKAREAMPIPGQAARKGRDVIEEYSDYASCKCFSFQRLPNGCAR
jgi:hypothetical protein